MRAGVSLLLVAAALMGCSQKAPAPSAAAPAPDARAAVDREDDPSTWIPRLADPARFEDAVRELERIGDPVAIAPLGEAWRKRNRAPRALRAVIAIADRSGKWADAAPFLMEAVTEVDETSDASIDLAVMACDALGRSGHAGAVDALIAAATRQAPRTAKVNRVRVAAVRTLGRFRAEPRVVDALIAILGADPEAQAIALNAAAALALGELGDQRALHGLVMALPIERIYQQVRRGITLVGRPAIPVLVEVMQGRHAELAARAEKLGLSATAPGMLRFKAALLLGDLRATEALPALIAELQRPPASVYVVSGQASPISQHSGVLDALRRLGPDATSAAAVWAYLEAPTTAAEVKPIVVDVYSMIVPAGDQSRAAALLAIANGRRRDETLRIAAVIAWSRIARTAADATLLRGMAKRAAFSDWASLVLEGAARIDAVAECQADVTCLAAIVTASGTSESPDALPRAERALLELARLGAAGGADAATPALLARTDTTVGAFREVLLLTLPRIAALPCPACEARLAEVIASQDAHATLDRLTLETRIVQHWFRWAGR